MARLKIDKDQFTKGDVTTAAQAKSKADVDNQDWKTRLWQSLKTTYGSQRRESAKQYNQAKRDADRQAQSRGMGRSSYNNQTLANIDKERVNADNNIYSALIADYQNRLQQEQQWQDQLKLQQQQLGLQQQQFAWQQQQAAAAGSGSSGHSGSYNPGTNNPGTNGDTTPDWYTTLMNMNKPQYGGFALGAYNISNTINSPFKKK